MDTPMPTENRSSNTEMVSAAPAPKQRIYVEVRECEGCNHIGIDDAHKTLGACHECDWSGPEPVEDKCPGCGRENVMAAACPDCGSRYVLAASKEFEIPAPPPHPEPIAWMVGTAFWWTKEEAERDAAATGLLVVPFGPLTGAGDIGLAREMLRRALRREKKWALLCGGRNKQIATLSAKLAELVSAVRSINFGPAHAIQMRGDDEPCYPQRKEWIEWLLELCEAASVEPSAPAGNAHG